MCVFASCDARADSPARGPAYASRQGVGIFRSNVLLCDQEREGTDLLAADLRDLGHAVTIARSCADTFSAACSYDFDALVLAPILRDGSALILPAALGIRTPKLTVLMCRLGERLARSVTRRVGFDAQLTKVVDARELDRLLRASITETIERALASASVVSSALPGLDRDPPPPESEVSARGPR